MNERPLVAFTLLSQTAVGAFLTLGALDLWAGDLAGAAAARTLTDGLLLAIGPVVGVAMLFSLLHLGTPRNAWRSAANLRASWLSREILCALLFAGTGAAFAVSRWSGAGSAGLRTLLAIAGALSGIALVYAEARVYRIRTVPCWDTPLTTVSFFATALLLGPLAVGTGLVLLPGLPDELLRGPLHWITLAAAAGCGAEIAAAGRGTLHGVRRLLLMAGVALCVVLLLSDARFAPALVATFAVALAAQVLGRYLFYVDGLRRAL
jgi:anaerobic dimethyl sulfoxide reductase subunit C (anchor subunit)